MQRRELEENYITRDELAVIMGSQLGRNPKRTLKFYEMMGLIPRAILTRGRRGGVSAYYPRSVINRLKKIKELQKRGLTLREIREKLKGNQVSALELLREYLSRHRINEMDAKVLLFLKFEEPELYRLISRIMEMRERLGKLEGEGAGDHPQDQ